MQQPLDKASEPVRGQTFDPKSLPLQSLTLEEIGAAERRAQIDGVAAGTCGGFIGSFISSRMFKQSRNAALLSGLLTGVATGYMFTRAALQTHLAKASTTSTALRRALADENSPNLRTDLDREGGVGGMEDMHDKYASTRGDH